MKGEPGVQAQTVAEGGSSDAFRKSVKRLVADYLESLADLFILNTDRPPPTVFEMPPGQIDLSKLRIRHEEGLPPRDGKPSWAKYGIYGSVIILIVAAGFLFFRTITQSEESVTVAAVSLTSPSQASAALTASGYVVAQRKASVASKATGRLVSLRFREGDRVKKGDVIGQIESADVEAALEQTKADLSISQADLTDAKRTLERSKQLLASNLIAQADFDAAQARYDRVIATIQLKEAAVRSADVAVENTRIRAPFDGTILTKNADIGEVVAPFAAGASSRVAIVTLADMASLEVEADVSESSLERVKPRQSCEITLDAYPERSYRGVVDKIVPTADRAKATVLTKVMFLERDNRVLPEMSAKVHFLSGDFSDSSHRRPVLAVSASSIVRRDGKDVVFVLHENRVTETPVVSGERMGDLIEIRSGLAAGEKVVMNPSERLQSGSRVKVQ